MSSTTPLVTTIVRAGAGTGKTESLANRIIEVARALYAKNQTIPNIIATTFTERATVELRERVVQKVLNLENPESWLREFVLSPKNLNVSTIHGTFYQFLRIFGISQGLDPNFTIMTEIQEKDLVRKCMRQTLKKGDSYKEVFNNYKFSELLSIMVSLLDKPKLEPFNINWDLVMKSRLDNFISYLERNSNLEEFPPSIKTFGSNLLGTARKFRDSNIQELWKHLNSDYSQRKGNAGKNQSAKIWLDELKTIGEICFCPEASPELNKVINICNSEFENFFSEVKKLVRSEKLKLGLLSFADIETQLVELCIQKPQVAERIQSQWSFWFIDEFQDTSPVQDKILKMLLRDPWNSYMVGDPQQSIYFFRGSDPKVFSNAVAEVENRKGKLETLRKNFRSHPDLVEFFNQVIANLGTEFEPLDPKGEASGTIRAKIILSDDQAFEKAVLVAIHEALKQGFRLDQIAVLTQSNSQGQKISEALRSVDLPAALHGIGGFYSSREIKDLLGLLSFLIDPDDDVNFLLICRSPWLGIDDGTIVKWANQKGRESFWSWIETQGGLPSTIEKLKIALELSRQAGLSTALEKLCHELDLFKLSLVGDSSGKREANIRKYLVQLRRSERTPGFNGFKFLKEMNEEIEAGEEKEAAGFVEPKRVNIMTVHKSKGLKFDVVILPGVSKELRGSPRLFESDHGNRFSLKAIDEEEGAKASGLACMDLKGWRKSQEEAEYLRLFYVAMTRAAEQVYLLGTEKISPKSWLASSGLSLTEGLHKFHEVRKITEFPETLDLSGEGDSKGELDSPEPLKIEIPLKQRMSVTRYLKSKTGVDPKELKSIPADKKLDAMIFGQGLHYIFEILASGFSGRVEELIEIARQKYPTQKPIAVEHVDFVLKNKDIPVEKLFRDGFAEFPFSFLYEECILEGQIDLWGNVDGITWVIDYKSAANFGESSEKQAKLQLQLYAEALKSLKLSEKSIKLAIVTPLEKQVRIFNF